MLIFFYKNDGRKLKQIITWLLKSWSATKIRRINYTQSYTLHENKIQKVEEKAVIIEFSPENQNKVEWLLKKSDIRRIMIKNIDI
jgi:DNA replicative helicase MCM subunit Mcm2 (Cdc46/Mcm family)